MQPHQELVVTEKADLDEKILKLKAFICDSPVFQALDIAERARLWQQMGVMRWYSDILGERVAAFS